jgi:hypothetical protein
MQRTTSERLFYWLTRRKRHNRAKEGSMKRLVPLCMSVLLVASCSSSPSSPTKTTPACQLNNTATITFENRSTSNTTYDVVWDGAKMTTVSPGSESQEYTVAAGLQGHQHQYQCVYPSHANAHPMYDG